MAIKAPGAPDNRRTDAGRERGGYLVVEL